MGMFDNIHDGNRHGQTKAFSPASRDLKIGDPVYIEDLGEAVYGTAPATRHTDGQVNCSFGGWLIVRDGIWVEWAEQPASDLPRFDNTGWAVDDDYERFPYKATEFE